MDAAPPANENAFLAWRRQNAPPPGSHCHNCGATLHGPWCHACGQAGEDHHRHAHHLVVEAIEGLFHADGRLLNTLPRLVAAPHRLTKDYLAGKRASQVPPLRIFLVALLLLFIVGGWAGQDFSAAITAAESRAGEARSTATVHEIEKALTPDPADLKNLPPLLAGAITWTLDHARRAVRDPDRFLMLMHEKAHDFAFLALPLAALILAGLFAFNRRFLLYDHLIFAMHSLGFQGFLLSAALAVQQVAGLRLYALWAAPVHLFVHMRGVYGTSVPGTLFRMALLAAFSLVGFLLLLAGLTLAGLAGLRA